MENIKVSLFDNDRVVHAITDISAGEMNGLSLKNFFEKIKAEFITGETAYLEVEGLRETPVIFEISPVE